MMVQLINTLKILTDFKHSDNRIEVHTRNNKGVAATRNDLLKVIKGDAFIFIDADDWIEPNMIETLVHDHEETGCTIAMCGLVRDGFTDAIPKSREIWTSDQVVIN